MKTTVYIPDEVKEALRVRATVEHRSEADIIREALSEATKKYREYPRPTLPLAGTSSLPADASEHLDDFLRGFGQQ